MKKPIFRGAGVAIITPYTEDGINFAELGRIIDDQIKNHTDAIIITGTTGESATMSDAEHRAAIKFAVEHVKGRIPVIAGTGSNETSYAVDLSKYAESVGADALLVVTPYYNKCTQKGLIAHYTAIADAVNIPIILYDVPSRTGVAIATETYVALSKHPNIVAVKEANGDLSKILRLRAAVGDDLVLYSGNDDQIVPILSLGGQGVISVLSNVAPQETHDMCQAFFDGDTKKAEQMQIEYADLIDALFCEVNPIPVKVAMRKLGYDAGPLRMPLSEMEPQHEEKLEAALRNHGLIK
ncbi:putative dihydrodipicolinate synthase [Selenomonas ruminantium subsp. lactilytica TAM6421]|uniref:4-hydroxy-tetrahydrodipicolinate synthase n=1 Tax=Selenomonas ruminantium subsp. lactilytica (strain NBRC 103574 / TAM6421) TaxID=927704 RepID=I0GSJ6_SELRL|nr:4-hydroxy-tetrahydrodipicolinate synthase [Selenomonas ruminantium]BAL83733.1 putative dihydrodipicolinate synthase [Selenomonas ruminantium subsp. lactilytica TAM6421]